jgi:hypothetical protein
VAVARSVYFACGLKATEFEFVGTEIIRVKMSYGPTIANMLMASDILYITKQRTFEGDANEANQRYTASDSYHIETYSYIIFRYIFYLRHSIAIKFTAPETSLIT